MDATDRAHSASATATAAPPARPVSLEITPDEYDYYLKQAHEMRAEAMTALLSRWFAALGRLFARAKPAPRRHAPMPTRPMRRHAVSPPAAQSRTA